jgi:hypothetical protein
VLEMLLDLIQKHSILVVKGEEQYTLIGAKVVIGR